MLIGQSWTGSFGDIYLGEDIETKERVAIKLENATSKAVQLQNEYKFYRMLGNHTGFPKVYWFGLWDHFNTLIMQLLGLSLEEAFESCLHNFSLKTILYTTMQLLDRFEYIHSNK